MGNPYQPAKAATWQVYCFFAVFVTLIGSPASAESAKHPAAAHACQRSNSLSAPNKLSETCLYNDIHQREISTELHSFTPNFQLWTDGAHKSRWIYLPEGTQIDTRDNDRWRFPVGTQFFKEFRKIIALGEGKTKEIRVETRHLHKVKDAQGKDAWLISTYAWLPDQSDAILNSGSKNVLDTPHDIPTQEDCVTCHKGNSDFILGFDTVQLNDALQPLSVPANRARPRQDWTLQSLINDQRLTHPPATLPTLPGTATEQRALGYLHGNCGGCHNSLGHAAERDAKHLKLRHVLSATSLAETDVYKTAVNQRARNFTFTPYIAKGGLYEELAIYQSALFIRMLSVDENYRMPMLGTKAVDHEGVDIIHQWLMTIETPEDDEDEDEEEENDDDE